MESDGDLRGEHATEVTDSGLLSIATFAAELESLVDQMDCDLANRRPIARQTADRIHQLRQQAEQLFGTDLTVS